MRGCASLRLQLPSGSTGGTEGGPTIRFLLCFSSKSCGYIDRVFFIEHIFFSVLVQIVPICSGARDVVVFFVLVQNGVFTPIAFCFLICFFFSVLV